LNFCEAKYCKQEQERLQEVKIRQQIFIEGKIHKINTFHCRF
jgi:hypothetical protein